MKTIYLTGATGRLGREVLRMIPDATPLVRKDSGLEGQIVTDFSERELRGILNDADVIIHIAGSIDTLDKRKLQESNVELTRRMVASAPDKCRIIFAGSVSVYGKKLAHIPADEGTQTNPDSDYARSKLEAEKIVSEHPDHVILRIGTIYGPGFDDYYKVLSYIEKGKVRIIGDGSNRVPFVHVEDVADAFANAVSRGGGTYVIAGEPLTQKGLYSVAAKALNVPEPAAKVSRSAADLLASFQEFAYRLGGKKPVLTKEHIGVLANDRVFDCSKARKELGFNPRSLEHGILEMVLSYKKRAPA